MGLPGSSILGEYSAWSSSGVYSRLRELTDAILPCLLPSKELREFRFHSALVCRDPTGENVPGGMLGRCISRLERPDWRRRGGGGGGGMPALVWALSLVTAFDGLRVECTEEVRVRSEIGEGDPGWDSSVVLRDDDECGGDTTGLCAPVEESALDVFVARRTLPWRREGGGGGGDF